MPVRTLSDLRTYVKTLVGDPAGTDFFSDAAYYRFISDAYLACARLAGGIKETATTMTSTASTATYNVTGLAAISHVDYEDKPLMPISADLLYALDADWETRTGTPEYVVLNHTADMGYMETADTEVRQFLLYPMPDTTTADAIRVIGPTAPTAITTAADEPSCLPDWAHDMVAFEGAARILESYGDQRNDELAKAYRELRDIYGQMLAEYRSNKHNKKVWVKNGVIGGTTSRDRDTHINATGRAGSGA